MKDFETWVKEENIDVNSLVIQGKSYKDVMKLVYDKLIKPDNLTDFIKEIKRIKAETSIWTKRLNGIDPNRVTFGTSINNESI